MGCFWTDMVGCSEACAADVPLTCQVVNGSRIGSGSVIVAFSLPAEVVNASLSSAVIHYDPSDYNGCSLSPGDATPIYASGGPFALTYSGGLFNSEATNIAMVGYVAGTGISTGSWWGDFVVVDLDTGIEYLGQGAYTSCS